MHPRVPKPGLGVMKVSRDRVGRRGAYDTDRDLANLVQP